MSLNDRYAVVRFILLPGHVEYSQAEVLSLAEMGSWLEFETRYGRRDYGSGPWVLDVEYGVGIQSDESGGFLWFRMPEHLYDFRTHEGVLYSLVRHLKYKHGDDYASWLHPTLNLVTRAVPGIHGVPPETMRTLIGAAVLCAFCGTEDATVKATEEHITQNMSPTQYIGM